MTAHRCPNCGRELTVDPASGGLSAYPEHDGTWYCSEQCREQARADADSLDPPEGLEETEEEDDG